MTTSVKTVKENTSSRQALELMHEGRFRHLPLVDDAGQVLGMLSVRDFLRDRIGELDQENEGLMSYISATAPAVDRSPARSLAIAEVDDVVVPAPGRRRGENVARAPLAREPHAHRRPFALARFEHERSAVAHHDRCAAHHLFEHGGARVADGPELVPLGGDARGEVDVAPRGVDAMAPLKRSNSVSWSAAAFPIMKPPRHSTTMRVPARSARPCSSSQTPRTSASTWMIRRRVRGRSRNRRPTSIHRKSPRFPKSRRCPCITDAMSESAPPVPERRACRPGTFRRVHSPCGDPRGVVGADGNVEASHQAGEHEGVHLRVGDVVETLRDGI